MDHKVAVQLGATERYLLDEFSAEEREQFEEHFFECAECAEDVRAASVFRANARAVFREERNLPVAYAERRWNWREFFAFRPALISVAANAVLVIGLGAALWRSEEATAPRFYPEFGLAQTSRGNHEVSLPVGTPFFGATFDLLPGQKFESFTYQIRDQSGKVVASGAVAAPPDLASEHLAVPVSHLKAGKYLFVLNGVSNGQATAIAQTDIVER